MSEIINNNKEKIKDLKELTQLVLSGDKDRDKIMRYRDKLKNISPIDVLAAEDKLVKSDVSIKELKQHIEKVLNVIGPILEDFKWEKPESDHPISLLIQENRKLEESLSEIKGLSKQIFNDESRMDIYSKLEEKFNKLKKFETHYIKKENILFPYLEEILSYDKPLAVMWSIHDDIRGQIKKIIEIIKIKEIEKYKKELANLLSLMNRMIFKEEYILFPVAYRKLKESIWDDIYNQFLEEGLFLINSDNLNYKNIQENNKKLSASLIKLPTGKINVAELEIILNNLPVELTYVGSDDRVKYFSGHEKRIFPRSKAVIGRKVQNCHPPESVDIVENILKDFKNGKKDKEHFRIKMKGKYIMINYYVLRDNDEKYMGTLEVTQDITEINSYQGEKRLIECK